MTGNDRKKPPTHSGKRRGLSNELGEILRQVVHSSNMDSAFEEDRLAYFKTNDADAVMKASERKKDGFASFRARRDAVRASGGDPSTIKP